MADFCKQCSIVLFDKDLGDLKGLCKQDEMIHALCESCGFDCIVDSDGTCISSTCLKKHGDK